MSRVQMTQAVAADYAEAMQVARRAKNALFFFLSLVLLIQLGVFFTVRYVPGVKLGGEAVTLSAPAVPEKNVVPVVSTDLAAPHSTGTARRPAVAAPTTAPAASASESEHLPVFEDPRTQPAVVPATAAKSKPPIASAEQKPAAAEITSSLSSIPFDYVIAATDFLGVILSVALAMILLLIIMMVLVGKPRNLIGVSHVTGAFCWSIMLVVLLFPWQSLTHVNVNSAAVTAQPAADQQDARVRDMTIPGVLYTYSELARDYEFSSTPLKYAILKWSRFVAFPSLSLIILLMIQGRSSRGMRSAVGEAEVIMDVPR